jgi:hypothetical protein
MKTRFNVLRLLFATAFGVFSFSTAVEGSIGDGQTGIFQDTLQVSETPQNGSATTLNWLGTQGGTTYPVNLGNITALAINAYYIGTYRDQSQGGNSFQPNMYYNVQLSSASQSSYNFSTANPISYNSGSGNNQYWQTTGVNYNLLSGLTIGDEYTLEFYYSDGYSDNNGNGVWYDNNGSVNNYQVIFTVVPEPVTLALPIFGGLMLTAGLVRRLVSQRANG